MSVRCAAQLCSEPGFGYGSAHGIVDAIMLRNRVLAAGITVLAAGLADPAINGNTQEAAITCTNPISGFSWQIVIDYRNATVDASPAAITPAAITWFDPKDRSHYRLDRQSGDLGATVASSTGGYSRHARCDLATTR
jgi:hypothetical protein